MSTRKKIPNLWYFLCSAILSFSDQRVAGPDATCLVPSGTTATSAALHHEVVEPSDGITVFDLPFDLCVCMSHIDYICVYVCVREKERQRADAHAFINIEIRAWVLQLELLVVLLVPLPSAGASAAATVIRSIGSTPWSDESLVFRL